jgi:5-methyltetrahydrofolate--homocysteine methyltransferase
MHNTTEFNKRGVSMIIIGEKINGSIPSMAKAIAEKNADHIRNLAKKQAEAGADFIDVCASVSPDTEFETLKWLIDLVQEVTDTPISIDSPNAKVFAEAIGFCKKPGLINSVSMEGDKIERVFPVIAGTQWECVALLCDDTGIPDSAENGWKSLTPSCRKPKPTRSAHPGCTSIRW